MLKLTVITFCFFISNIAVESIIGDGFVPNESGFEGAVTVISEEVDSDFGIVTVKVPYLDI